MGLKKPSDTFPFIVPLWEHQKEAFNRAVVTPNYAFFMEMGVGKTATTINTLRYRYAQNKRVMRTVVIAPIVTLENWKREIGVHSKSVKQVAIVKGNTKKKLEAIRSGKQILVLNYETFTSRELHDAIFKFKPEIVIVDESQRIKNYKAKRTKAIVKLGRAATYRYILSGSPILNSPMDIFSQYHFLDQGATFGSNFFAFRAQFFEDKNAGMPSQKYFPDWKPKPSTAQEVHDLIYKKASRVTKAEALDLPPMVRKEVHVEMSGVQARMYEDMKEDLISYLGNRACVAKLALTKALRLQQIVSGFFVDDDGRVSAYEDVPRLAALKELVEQIVIDGGHSLIIWAGFKANYSMIGKVLTDLKLEWCEIVGGMTDKARQKAIDDLQSGEKKIVIANQKAGGVGVNLTTASYSLYYSKNFSLEDDLQSEARNHRGGSEVHDKITRIDLVCPGTIDEKITKALSKKMKVADDILSLRELIE